MKVYAQNLKIPSLFLPTLGVEWERDLGRRSQCLKN